MKHTILYLKKKVLVVETLYENLACAYFFNKYGFDFMKKMKFICQGSEITEEIAAYIVEKSFDFFRNYLSKEPVANYSRLVCRTALESFKSAIQSNNFHWLENPLGGKPKITTGSNCFELIAKHNDWQQAEEKTFKSCLIFEII